MIFYFGLLFLIIPLLTTWFWFICNVYFQLPLNLFSLSLSLILSLALSLFIPKPKIYWPKIKLTLPLLFLTAILGFNLLQNYYWPVSTEFDAITAYDYKAKVFYHTQKITGINDIYLGSYPLFTSLAHSAMYNLGFQNPKPFYFILTLGLIFIAYSLLRRQWAQDTALAFCALLATTPAIFHYSTIAYTNFPYAVYFGLSLIFLDIYLKSSQKYSLLLFSFFLAAGSWIRPAHLPFFLTNLVILFAFRRNIKLIILPVLFYLVISLPWAYYQYGILHLQSYETKQSPGALSSLLAPADYYAQIAFSLPANMFDVTFAGFTVMAILIIIRKFSFDKLLTLILLINILAWCVLSLAIRPEFPEFTQWQSILYDSMRRIFIFVFIPLIFLPKYYVRYRRSNSSPN